MPINMQTINRHINEKHGGRKGLLNHIKFSAMSTIGFFKKHQQIPSTIGRLVFVCKGNICRSPLGEEVAKQTQNYRTASFGLDTTTGKPAFAPIVDISKKLGYSLEHHKTTAVEDHQHQHDDLIICVEPKHLKLVQKKFPKSQVVLLGLFLNTPKAYIHDPYSSNLTYKENCSKDIIEATKNLLKKMGD